jgi:hypothetical protein
MGCNPVQSVGVGESSAPVKLAQLSPTAQIDRPELTGSSPQSSAQDSYTISNDEWTITIGNLQSWSGVNNTGNLSYYGCDSQQHCLKLDGGKMSCRDGICAMGWSNGEYFYSIQSPMTAGGSQPSPQQAPETSTTLTVRKGNAVILETSGFRKVQP